MNLLAQVIKEKFQEKEQELQKLRRENKILRIKVDSLVDGLENGVTNLDEIQEVIDQKLNYENLTD